MLRAHDGKEVFSEKTFRFVTALDLIECLKQINQQGLLAPLTGAPISGNTIYYKHHASAVKLKIFPKISDGNQR